MRPSLLHLLVVPGLLLTSCGGPIAGTTSTSPTDQVPLSEFRADPDTIGQLAQYVVCAFTDSRGVRWFGTMGHGVARYDGKTLTYLHPADGRGGDVVSSIAEDKAGHLWFAGHDGTGVVRYDGTHFTQLWEEESGVSSDGAGHIWASTASEVFRNDGDRLVPFALPIDRAAITSYSIVPGRASLALKDSNGNLWFRTDGHGLLKYDGTDFTHYTKENGLCSNSVNQVVEDDQGRIWVICMQAYQPMMTNDGGLCRLDGDGFTTFPDVEGLHNNDLYTLFKDRDGDLWIGATGVGVYRYDGSSFTLFAATDRPDLNGGFGLQDMTQDRNGTLWCAFSGGLFRFDGRGFVNVMRNGPWE
ncbi:MAG: hypothetical protein H6597_04565 [Flavobacteriales bacterium]|nr:hypothetical protein [Flavobacteriales bacterium]MCB9193786.1 hypothetical protein [Flavobacteriales bacterium]